MTDTAQERYRKIRRTMANQWRYIKRCHNQELRLYTDVQQRLGRLERELNGTVVIRRDSKDRR